MSGKVEGKRGDVGSSPTDDEERTLSSFEGMLNPRRTVMSVHGASSVPLNYGCQSNLGYFLLLL